ncbi:hypothetical protein Taro_003301 [Colocasia esculenta]|uniref:Galactose oxidase n=1 Tax=Colocasia esculenta TaxID=4460 RepID=A0A843TNF3_COLES|nr:hypothetical protein [Colocasia esculenta]
MGSRNKGGGRGEHRPRGKLPPFRRSQEAMARQLQALLLLLPLLASPGYAQVLGFLDSVSQAFLGGQAFGPGESTPENLLGTSQVAVGDSPPQPLATTGEGYDGKWELLSENSGVSAMHMVVMHTNKVILFDATNFGPSNISLANGECIPDASKKNKTMDCYAHAVEFDTDTGNIKPLKVWTNPWCASGALSADGVLVQTGGWSDGGKAVRYLESCPTCDWKEYTTALSGQRWYATQQILPDGSFIVIGGRRMFNYEFVPKEGQSNTLRNTYYLPLLRETTDEVEDNLYPFVHLSTDGNLFVMAHNRSILLDYKNNKVVREFPVIDGARNYPASAMSVLLPLKLYRRRKDGTLPAEVLVCGGSPPMAAKLAGGGTFNPALRTCGRLNIVTPGAQWRKEFMPIARVMGDMLNLPNGDVLMVNGASKGAAGWGFARNPTLNPVLYTPTNPRATRFRILNPSTIPRMYHSTAGLLLDGTILVAGSNTNAGYFFSGKTLYPTELRVEKFYPPYLDPELAGGRPTIPANGVPQKLTYDASFTAEFGLGNAELSSTKLIITMYAPPFTTHGYSMNQRLLILKINQVEPAGAGSYKATVMAPATAVLAPPGYYMLFVVHQTLPSKGVWVHIQ